MIERNVTDILFDAVLQIDPVDTFCRSSSENAMTVPEFNTTILTIFAFVLVVGGLFVLVLFGGAQWAIAKLRTGHGGGDGKGAAVAGAVMILLGIVALTIPSLSGEFWTGAEACFAVIQPMTGADLALMVR